MRARVVIKYSPRGSNYFLDTFSRNRRIPKIGTIIIDKSLSSAPLEFLQIPRFVVGAGDCFDVLDLRNINNAKKQYVSYEKRDIAKAQNPRNTTPSERFYSWFFDQTSSKSDFRLGAGAKGLVFMLFHRGLPLLWPEIRPNIHLTQLFPCRNVEVTNSQRECDRFAA